MFTRLHTTISIYAGEKRSIALKLLLICINFDKLMHEDIN